MSRASILDNAGPIKPHLVVSVVTYVCLGVISSLPADEPDLVIDAARVRSSIERVIPVLEKAAAGSADQRECFTCHNQAIPVLALARALELGFDVDKVNLSRQVRHTFAHLERGKQKYEDGKGQGGREVTAGYALWTLEAGGHAPDGITSAVTRYILGSQQDSDHWQHASKRPPSSGSPFMTSYVAMRGLNSFGTEDQQSQIVDRRSAVKKWLTSAQPQNTEDRVFQLRLLSTLQSPEATLETAVQEILALQKADGGWSQLPDIESHSDAYATGTVVAALQAANADFNESGAVHLAIGYLLREQLDDGSWLVRTRAEGFQEYFESGFPHDEHQFISTSASAWSTLALLNFLNSCLCHDGKSNTRPTDRVE